MLQRGGARRARCSCSTRRPPTSTSIAGRCRPASWTATRPPSSGSALWARRCGADCASAGSARRQTSSDASSPRDPPTTSARPSSSRRSLQRSSRRLRRDRRAALARAARGAGCRWSTALARTLPEWRVPAGARRRLAVDRAGCAAQLGARDGRPLARAAAVGGSAVLRRRRPRPAPAHSLHGAARRAGPRGRHPRRCLAPGARRCAGVDRRSSSTRWSDPVERSPREDRRQSIGVVDRPELAQVAERRDSVRGSGAPGSGGPHPRGRPGGGRSTRPLHRRCARAPAPAGTSRTSTARVRCRSGGGGSGE